MKCKKLTILGGGSAGFVSALILKTRFPKLDITLIRSSSIGIIGVGEGSTEHWSYFMKYVGIDLHDLIINADATLKHGVMFDGWTKEPFLHSVPAKINNLRIGQYLGGYGNLISKEAFNHKLNHITAWTNEVDVEFINSTEWPANQFHFNTFKLNSFLEEKAKSKGIVVIEDDIIDVEYESVTIKKIIGKKDHYVSDFYIDCSGFRKELISKLGGKWKSYSKWLKMKEAIAFPTDDTPNYNSYTLAKAMKYGWMFRIPVYGRWGNGYIFDSDYISAADAKLEVESIVGKEIEIGRNIKFDPGCIDRAWIGNCLAVGLSANFVEPLEATSIGTTINQIFMFLNYFSNYNQSDIDQYNNKLEKIMENIRDFIILHYLTDRDDTEFWRDVKKIDLPDSLNQKLEKWKHRLPVKEDFSETEYFLFFEQNWTNVLYGLKFFNIDSIRSEYESYDSKIKDSIESLISIETESKTISHKKYLESIRKLKFN